ncbi:Gp19/Gp15/Gp42 family protein [uncultured Ruminococcus sp.]|uniref:Gp19/Gp15/Gp42 family protein n=1 Tax=uncultured Ruminococcus sp. TaxID=165186 RepID=UPI0026361F13|nr:Gp19/Gp15/Gp42 family protein [uncultured Ruminococcus sp.]
MAAEYATIEDVIRLGRKLTTEEQEKAAALLPVACAKLSTACKKYGKDLDIMIADEPDIGYVARDIIVRAVLRAVDTITDVDSSPAASQATKSAMGYSLSMTYLNAGQQLYFLRNELKELGVMRQRYGAMEVYDV